MIAPSTVLSSSDQELGRFVRSEIDILLQEHSDLLQLAGFAMIFINHIDPSALSDEASSVASALARHISAMPDETISDALNSVGRYRNPDDLRYCSN